MPDPDPKVAAVEEETILEKLTKAIDGLTKLTIVTEVNGGAEKKQQMKTVIDLIDGDITNSIHREFVTGDLKDLRDFHQSQVNRGQEIIKENIAALKAIYELVKNRDEDN